MLFSTFFYVLLEYPMNMNIQNIYLKMCDHFINNHTIVYLIIAYAHKLHYKHYTKNDNVLKFISMNINDK